MPPPKFQKIFRPVRSYRPSAGSVHGVQHLTIFIHVVFVMLIAYVTRVHQYCVAAGRLSAGTCCERTESVTYITCTAFLMSVVLFKTRVGIFNEKQMRRNNVLFLRRIRKPTKQWCSKEIH
jgi:hypothetical protein